jgi:RNA polymerase sigma-70 factor, ECF subfamily
MKRAGDCDFDEFFAATFQRVVGQVYAMIGNLADAEDAVQDAYARAWQRWDKLSGLDQPEAWVRVVAYRIAVSAWRKTVNRLTAHRRFGTDDQVPALDPDHIALVQALRRISPEQRRAIVLYHLVGLSVNEIAAETDSSAGTVKSWLSRGRRALAPHVSELAPPDPPAPAPDRGGSDGPAARAREERPNHV